jgi:adenine-specific DNA-methyltransferase
MDKLKLHTPDVTDANIVKIAELFPSCVTEAINEDGKLVKSVDFDALRQELSKNIVEGPRERYHLNWPGKNEALLKANAPVHKTLRPAIAESVDFETSRNLFIEGDNLDALKLLQDSYLHQIKLIYIDPPYNTGRNLIYKNDFSESPAEFLERSGQIGADGGRLIANTESNGRFHSDWLSMIYPRLKVAKNLLRQDGILVCAIDENEFSTLSLLMKEIFHEGSFEHSYVSIVHNPRGQQGTNFSYVNEYLIFVYPADKKKHLADFKKEEIDARNLRDSGTESDRTDARNCFYPFLVKDGKIISVGDVPEDSFHPSGANVLRKDGVVEIWPISEGGDEKKWRYARQSVSSILSKLEPKTGRSSVQIIFNKDTGTIRSVWANAKYDSSEYGTKLLEEMIPGAGFTYPKSLWAVYDAILAGTAECKDAVVLDFFAGSSTTAHATMKLNSDDGGSRSFIMVQYPEPTDENSEPFGNGFRTIADISKERIRRAGKLVQKDAPKARTLDLGFRVLKVDSSNMRDVYYRPDDVTKDDLFGQVDNIKEDRSPEDLLFQVLIDWGVDLSLPINKEKSGGKSVFFVDENALAACFDRGIDEALVKFIAERKPMRVVFRDSGFESDSLKINVEQIFKQLSPGTEIRTI